MNERGAISHALYEPGQIIVATGETRRFHYLVESGDLDVVSSEGNKEAILQSLKAGDYFGEGARPRLDCSIGRVRECGSIRRKAWPYYC